MNKIYIPLFFVLVFIEQISAQVQHTNFYSTAEQLFLANEINESGEPFAEALGYNLDDLDPFVLNSPDSIAYTLGIENYEYSRYQLGTIVSRSGMGLHMMWAPIIMAKAAMMDSSFDGSITGTPNGYNEDDELFKTIMHFGMLSHFTPFKHPWPQFAEFISGDPHLPQSVDADNFNTDFKTLRWDRSKMDKTLNPAAMGQSLMKQYLWAQDMLGGLHDADDNPVDPTASSPDSSSNPHFDPANNVFYGGDAIDGFIGQVLTAEAINKMLFMNGNLAYDGNSLGAVNPASYTPADGIKYFPHKIAVTETIVKQGLPPKLSSLEVTDASSELFDQISLLWGTLHFKNMMDPNINDEPHAAYHYVFDGDPFPPAASQSGIPGPFDLMKGSSKVLFLNIKAMHFNNTEGTFINTSNLNNGNVEQGTEINTVNAGYSIVILAKFIQEFTGTPLENMAHDLLVAQADFIINKLKNNSGGFYNSYTIGTGADTETQKVVSVAAAIRGLYAAYTITNNNNYLTEANDGYNYLITNFYLPEQMAFKTDLSSTTAIYTPFNFAIIAGALREAKLVGNNSEAPIIYTRFFKNIGNRMQLCEAGPTGETGNDSDGDGVPFLPQQPDGLPPIFAPQATFDLVTDVKNNNAISYNFNLEQNYPNPFNPTTTIKYSLPGSEFVTLKVFNVLGKEVITLVNKTQAAGNYIINFNSQNLTSGIYVYQLKAGNNIQIRKMVLLK